MTLLEKEKPKVIVILNFYSQSVDLLDYPEEIEDNVGVCCAITMEPDEVLVLIDKLKSYIEENE